MPSPDAQPIAETWVGLGTTSCGKAPPVKALGEIHRAFMGAQRTPAPVWHRRSPYRSGSDSPTIPIEAVEIDDAFAAFDDEELAALMAAETELLLGHPAAGAAARTVDREALPKGSPVVDLVSQTPADAAGPHSASPADAAEPHSAVPADAAQPVSAAGAAYAGDRTQAEMLEWATQELATRKAEAQADWEALSAAEVQHEADRAALHMAGLGAREDAELRRRMEAEAAGWRRQMAKEAACQAAFNAKMAQLARALASMEEALAEAKAIFNSLREH